MSFQQIVPSILIILFGLLSEQSFAEADFYQWSHFTPRTESECRSASPEQFEWYYSSSTEAPPIETKLGPIREQKGGLCYAYTAADILSYHLGIQVSAIQLAQLYYDQALLGRINKLFGDTESGYVDTNLRIAKGKMLCSEQDFPSKNMSYKQVQGRSCEATLDLSALNYRVYSASVGYKQGHHLFEIIDRQLDQGDLVAVDYIAEIVKLGYLTEKKRSSGHYSSLIARKWNSQKQVCEYMMRNSWGRQCYNYIDCKQGYYVLSEKKIALAVQGVTWIELLND